MAARRTVRSLLSGRWPAVLQPRALDYLVLVVTDVDRSVRFWRDVIGADHQHTSGDYAQFRLGEVRLGLFGAAAMAARGRTAEQILAHYFPGATVTRRY